MYTRLQGLFILSTKITLPQHINRLRKSIFVYPQIKSMFKLKTKNNKTHVIYHVYSIYI